jgi:zinc transport system substrate-binding protein
MIRSPRTPAALLLLVLAMLLLGCGDSTDPARNEPAGTQARSLQVRTTCFPVHWLVERIAGDRLQAINVLPEGQDPPHWHPSTDLVAELAEVDLIVVNGAGFEAWIKTTTLPVSRVVDTSRGLDLIEIEDGTHSHGLAGKHSHSGTDPHTWSDPLVYLDQARAVHAALARTDPTNSVHYDRALKTLAVDLQELDREFTRILSTAGGWRLAANHPAYNYLARRYGLNIRSFDFDPTRVPSEEQLSQFAAWAAGTDPLVLLWETKPDSEVSSVFPLQVRHVVIDPLEQPGEDKPYDYLAQARSNLATFEALFGNPATAREGE